METSERSMAKGRLAAQLFPFFWLQSIMSSYTHIPLPVPVSYSLAQPHSRLFSDALLS